MSYLSVKNYIDRRMAHFRYFEAKEKFDVSAQGDMMHGKKYMMENPQTLLEDGDTLCDRFFPQRQITIKVSRMKTESDQIGTYDEFQDELDFMIADLHNPANFQGEIRNVSYVSHIVEAFGDYILATINLSVEDELLY